MKRTAKYLIALAMVLATAQFSFAQEKRTVTGTVTDTAGEPIIGAAVIAGPGVGTTTDLDGAFSIKVSDADVTLEISCISYETLKINVPKDQLNVKVVLQDDAMMLEETVVVGYGVQKKVNLTGAISTVTSKDLANRTSPDLTHMLQGAVPGLSVTTSTGSPQDEASINIRGVNSLNGGTPLVLIDGVEGSLSKVNPQDVESVSVIKDASSSAIYGARASFGVVLVTTKSGANSNGKPTVRYSGHVGFTTPTTCTDYIDTGYWSVYITDLFERGTTNSNCTYYNEDDMAQLLARVNDKTEDPSRPWVITEMRGGVNSYIYYANTDWYHELYTDFNPMTQQNFSVSGGNENMRYYFSGGYEHKDGTFKIRHDNYNKYNLRAKLDFKLNKWLDLSNNISFYTSDYDYPGNGSENYTFSYGAVHGLASFPVRNPDGSNVYKTVLLGSNVTNGCHMELLEDTKVNKVNKYNFSNTAELTAHVIKGLDIKGNITITLDDYKKLNRWTNASYSKYPGQIDWDRQGRFENKLETKSTRTKYMATNIYANYVHSFEKGHNISAVAGFNYEHEHMRKEYIAGKNLSTPYLSDWNLVQDPSFTVTGGQSEYAIAGIFGRFNYNYKEKYLFEVSGRFDGTSRFLTNHRWGFFPSASIGWKFSEEDFMKNVSWLNMGKLRLSYGALGNQQVGNYDFMRLMDLNKTSYLFESDTQYGTGAKVTAPNAGDLTWEVAEHYNLGLDIAALENRITFTGEAYIRNTNGMLGAGDPVPATYGAGSPEKNGPCMQSRGYEITIGWRDTFQLGGSPFHYGINASLADYISVITKYQNPSHLMGTFYEGMVMGEIWGYKTDGLFRTDEEAKEWTSKHSQSNMETNLNGGWLAGDVKYLDLDNSGEINSGSFTYDEPGDLRIIGYENPRYQYGITLNADWKGFDFSIFFQGIGHQDWFPPVYCHSFWHNFNQASQTFVPKDWLSKVWSEDNPDAYFPRPRASIGNQGSTEITTVNDRYLQNIGYCRLKNLTIGYTLPEKIIDKLPVSNVRAYFTGENLAYMSPLRKVTKYMDPEQCATSAYLGFLYPWQKSFIFGIDVTF